VSVMDGTTNGPAGSFDLSGIVPTAMAVDPPGVLPVTLEVAAPLELPRALPPTGNETIPLLGLGVGLLGLGLAAWRASAAYRPHSPKETS
jgi:hypothetical protein